MEEGRHLQPAFALCDRDWSLVWASPRFLELFPSAAPGRPLSALPWHGLGEALRPRETPSPSGEAGIFSDPAGTFAHVGGMPQGSPAAAPVPRFLSPDAPDAGAEIRPSPAGRFLALRWATLPSSSGSPLRLLDVLDLPAPLFGLEHEHGDLHSSLLELLIDSIHDGIWIIDGNGIILRVNKAMQRIADIRAEEVVGKHVQAAMELKKFTACVSLHALEARRTVTMFDDYANGHHCLNTSTPIFDEHGNVVRVIAIIRDLTELEDMSMRLEAQNNANSFTPYAPGPMDPVRGVIGRSQAAWRLNEAITMAARTDAPILLLGETGTGKTMMAKTIHLASARKDTRFVSLNCGAIPASLVESELFGYDAGAFTGALRKGKKGVFEMADRGTLFLDEIGELPLSAQATLLNVLDGEPFRRVGGTSSIHVDVRIIAATNRSLTAMVREGTFRKDLFYRLRVIAIEIPPLRERREDIPVFFEYFMKTMGGQEPPVLSASLREALSSYKWPGNVREVRSVTRFLLALGKRRLLPSDLPSYLLAELPKKTKVPSSLKDALENLERDLVARALRETGSTYKAARMLKVSQSTIVRKARRYRLGDAAFIEHS